MIGTEIGNNETTVLKEVKYELSYTGKCVSTQEEKKPDTIFLYFTTITVNLLVLADGALSSWPSPAVPKLLSNDTNINPLSRPITTIEISMMMGLPFISGLCGTVLISPLADVFGRKKCLQAMGLIMFLCNMIIAFSTEIVYIIIARCIFFSCNATIMTVIPIFITEICEDHNRTKHGCLIGLFLPVGFLYSFVTGPSFSIKLYTIIISVPLIFFSILFVFVPETPVFSLSKGREEECISSLKRLRSKKTSKQIEYDLEKVYETIKINQCTKNIKYSVLFKMKAVRIGLLLATSPLVIQHFSGGPILLFLLGYIFNQVDTYLSGDDIAIIGGVVQCIVYGITTFAVQKTGRKPLLFYSSVGCAILTFTLGSFFYLKHVNSSLANQLSWLPVVSIILYIVSFSIGLGPIPAALIGEMFGPDIRATAASFIIAFVSIELFFLCFSFPMVAEAIGFHWCFFILSLNCSIGACFIYTMIPETRGKSLVELQEIMQYYKLSLKWRK